MKEAYPFIPKSTAYLMRGQFWAVPLTNGKYGCGVVLHLLKSGNKKEQRLFHAGLLDWVGDNPPTKEVISDRAIIESGAAHIKAITKIGGQVLGKTKLPSGKDVIEFTDNIDTWGYEVIKVLGDKYFVECS